eukprot:3406523-Rhodomonas_salina.1
MPDFKLESKKKAERFYAALGSPWRTWEVRVLSGSLLPAYVLVLALLGLDNICKWYRLWRMQYGELKIHLPPSAKRKTRLPLLPSTLVHAITADAAIRPPLNP